MYNDFKIKNSEVFSEIKIITPDVFQDNRGFIFTDFLDSFFKDSFTPKLNFVHSKYAYNNAKVLRGIHGDFKTWKLVTCLEGEFLLLVVNNIKNDKEYKKSEFFKLSEKNNFQILIPPGFGNAHYVISKRAMFHYKQSTLYNRKSQFTIKWNSKDFNLKWPIRKKPITSKRDKE